MQTPPPGRYTTIAILGTIAVIICALLYRPPENSGDVAAWVQGVGTLAAVGVAAWTGLLPSRQEARRQSSRKREYIHTVGLAVGWAEGAIEPCLSAIADRDRSGLRLAVSTGTDLHPATPLRRLLAEPVSTWPSMSIFAGALAVTDAIDTVLAASITTLDMLDEGDEQVRKLTPDSIAGSELLRSARPAINNDGSLEARISVVLQQQADLRARCEETNAKTALAAWLLMDQRVELMETVKGQLDQMLCAADKLLP